MQLDLEILQELEPGEIFRVVTTRFQEFHQPGKIRLTFVCVAGGNRDWAIYAGLPDAPSIVAQKGDKVTSERTIRDICPCTDEAFERYRM